MIAEYVGAKLAEMRTARGETITSLSTSLAVSPDLMQRWERGEDRVPAEWLVKIALVLNCSISDFFRGALDLRRESKSPPHGT